MKNRVADTPIPYALTDIGQLHLLRVATPSDALRNFTPQSATEVCACETDVEAPGPHLPSCPWADPNYEPDQESAPRLRLAHPSPKCACDACLDRYADQSAAEVGT